MSKEVKIDPQLFETKKQKPKTRKSKKELLQELSGDHVKDLEELTNTPPVSKPRSILKNTTEKKYSSFGKKNNTVRIFIKDKDEYAKIESDKKKLNRHSMTQVRNYLKTRKLYTVGSTAPDDLLREIYVNTHLTGNIENSNPATLLQNFLTDGQREGIGEPST